ncbi:MAG: MBL fold metallo-hydrolase [Anaerolineaceae bacterium]|nr:MBL fold metallo-hydrolase [Anaerolineaceae bacterium]
MRIHFNGAARTVTGSQYLLEINGHHLLLECGLFQGKRKDTYQKNLNFQFNPANIDAVVLSHAHIDHSGNLPNLVKNGYSGPIYATTATAKLTDIMLRDSAHIQEKDIEFVNRKRLRRGESPLEPLYTSVDAERVNDLLRPFHYDEVFEPVPGVKVRLRDAGHILGSAGVELDIEEKGRETRLWFSGDIGRLNLPLLRDPVLPENVDYMIMECTYGDKPHRDPENAFLEFRAVVKKTVQRGGKVIIPAFAVGRTQELVFDLNRMMSNGDIPKVPVYVDSPLAVAASQIFRQFPDYFDEITNEFIREEKHPALQFDQLHYIQSVEESKKLNDRQDPMVIISASGMAEAGRILHHLRNNIQNPRNTVCIVGWQAPHTLGRRLADRDKIVRIFGELYELRAEVATIGGLSAHAGQDFLMKYALTANGNLRQIWLVHGEDDAAMALKQKLIEAQNAPVAYPAMYDQVVI